MRNGLLIQAALLAVALIAASVTGALAHKEKLAEDALTLVRQASALLAQNPGMNGEVKERLEAALKSRKPEGVDLKTVSAALRALDNKDITGARRLLLTAIMPAGMPMPPQGVRQTPGPSEPSAAPPSSSVPSAQQPPSVEVTMQMTEPLTVRYARSAGENALLAVSFALIGVGLTWLWRGRAEAQP